MKSLLDPTFKYTPAAETDIRKTFARERERQAKAKAAKATGIAIAAIDQTTAAFADGAKAVDRFVVALHEHRRK